MAFEQIHPIIQALGQLQQARQEAAQREIEKARLAETTRSNISQEQQAKERLKQEREIQDAAHTLAQETLNTNKQNLLHEQALADFNTRLGMTQAGVRSAGSNIQQAIPTLLNSIGGRPAQSSQEAPIPTIAQNNPALSPSNGNTFNSSLFGNLDLSGATPEAAGAREIQRKVAEYKAQEQAKIPFTEASNEAQQKRQLIVDAQTAAAKKEADALKQQGEETLHKMDNTSRERVANIAAHASLLKANAGEVGAVSPANIIAYGTGEGNFEANTPADQATRQAAEAAGVRRFDPKQKDALIAMQSLNPVFKKLDSFVNNYLPDESKPLATAKAVALGIIGKSHLPTDARNELDQIKTNALNYAKVIEGSTGGRVTVQQMELALAGLADPGKTKQQGRALIDNLKEQFVNKEQNVILGGMNETQKDMIAKRYGITLNSPGGSSKGKVNVKRGPNGEFIEEPQ